MTHKTAYLWGPVSSFSGPLAVYLLEKGWNVHIAVKSSLNVFSMSPLDLKSSAQTTLETAFGGRDKAKAFQERLKLIDPQDAFKGTKYDAVIFTGLPPNFDEARVPRAPWAASYLKTILKNLKGVPTFIVSSVWGGVQSDGVVPEEFEFHRRKAQTHWESICQQYENKLLENLTESESEWYLVRIPMMLGNSETGAAINFSGPAQLLRELAEASKQGDRVINLNYNADSTLWFLPSDVAVHMFWRFLEDESRPRICNLVSTQMTLNREWLSHAAQSLGLVEVAPSETDSLNLPSTLRKLLEDNVQIKTRNLFEVAGRYHLTPVICDKDYFEKVVKSANSKNWGHASGADDGHTVTFAEKLAKYYFEEFIPKKLKEGGLEGLTAGGISIGFVVKGGSPDPMGWILKNPDGTIVIDRYDPAGERPRVCFHFSMATISKIIQSRLGLHRAMLLRDVEVEGPILPTLKVAGILDKFLKEHPVEQERIDAMQSEERTATA